MTAFQVEREKLRGGLKKPEEATAHEESRERGKAVRARKRELWSQKGEPKPGEQLEEDIRYIKRKAARYIDWNGLGTLWNADPRADATHHFLRRGGRYRPRVPAHRATADAEARPEWKG